MLKKEIQELGFMKHEVQRLKRAADTHVLYDVLDNITTKLSYAVTRLSAEELQDVTKCLEDCVQADEDPQQAKEHGKEQQNGCPFNQLWRTQIATDDKFDDKENLPLKEKKLTMSSISNEEDDATVMRTLRSNKIIQAVIFILVVDVLTESLTIKETPILTKVARVILVSDILHNSEDYHGEFQ
ncbi:hypothetical protein SELMODRAFT_407594 [Selaginella moellendorffii]|uniref:Uncharacterized protein n=1 Tax=Selaginella moellendorffii TaxID=88036 RepID=D8R640_SELML|nr:hypothetical protein SELMODRAFT_407594 [Selaginella moellendorffii]